MPNVTNKISWRVTGNAWKCKQAQVSLKATIDVPMLGTIIEQNGDGLLDFFPIQRRMASARSSNMFPSMLHMRLIN